MKLKFRPNVAAILQNAREEILVCERIDVSGAWQFPQGGVDPGESPAQALVRELHEELSLEPEHYEILIDKGPYRYVLGGGRMKKGCHGQEQRYFLLKFLADESQINVATPHQEFRRTRWIRPSEFLLSWLPSMKREVYQAVFRDFFGVNLEFAAKWD
jgi:putative (di)nucleoside polyphosphate hydrolase